MRFLDSIDTRDRKLLSWCVGIAIGLAAITGFLLPSDNSDDNRVPSSYLTGQHGSRAAYDTLVRSGYSIERWERPLSDLASTAGPETVVIFAEPFTRDSNDIKAVRQIVERGGRVLSTGFWGGFILPGEASDTPKEFNFAACRLEPEGLDPLAASGEIWMVPQATWQVGNPAHRVQYSCAGQPAVVEYNWGKGHVVWWASATPLENASLARANNFDLLLSSLGSRDSHHFYWDESLHGEIRSEWSYAGGPALSLLRVGLPVLALLILFSFSRRSGPVHDLPPAVRASPVEYIEAMGSLYRNAGAASTAVMVAWERFRRHALHLCGLKGQSMSAADIAAAIRRRFPAADSTLEVDLLACEEATSTDKLPPREALRLVQTLGAHLQRLNAAARVPGISKQLKSGIDIQFKPQERAS